MGGNALKNTYTERKNTTEFLRIGIEIKNKILMDLELDCAILKCFHNKETHGDLDLLIKIPSNYNIDWEKYIRDAFKPNEIFHNGGVYSFDYQDFQIDFISIKENSWEISQTYGFYDPLGNIMGKTFHKFDLSYGWDGLFYKFRNHSGSNSADILLTNDARKIFDFGGYDYERYLLGFDTLEEIFKFCIEGKYFDAQMFEMENLKSIDKKRNRKRGSYHLFLTYLKDNGINTHYEFNKNKESYFPSIEQAFPEAKLLQQINALREDDRLNNIASQKFNGDIVMYWLPNLQGKQLGVAMGKFKNHLGDNYREFILNNDYHAIKSLFMSVYNGEQE